MHPWGCEVVPPGPAVRPRQAPAHSSVAAPGQAQDGPGFCPTSLVQAAWGEQTKACSSRHILGLHLFAVFIPDNPSKNGGLRVAHGDSTGCLPLRARPKGATALAPVFSSHVLVADGRSCCTTGGWAEGGATKSFQNSRQLRTGLSHRKRALHASTLSQRSTRVQDDTGQKSRPSASFGHLET